MASVHPVALIRHMSRSCTDSCPSGRSVFPLIFWSPRSRNVISSRSYAAMPDIWSRNPWPRQERVQHKERVRVMRAKGIKSAKKQWMICVETTAIEIPARALAKRDTRLEASKQRVWFRGRRNGRAKILERQDRQTGGRPELTEIEYRICPVCGRMLLGLEAADRRRLDESCSLGRDLHCSVVCETTRLSRAETAPG